MIRSLCFVAAASLIAAGLMAADPATSPREGLPENLDQYEHINAIVVPDPASPVMGFHHFYIDEKGLETFRAGKDDAEYPDGTVIVGKVFKPEKTEDGAYKEGDLLAYTLMRKDDDNSATKDTGGWHFIKLDAHGKQLKIDPVADCFHCHKPHAKADYVISKPLKSPSK